MFRKFLFEPISREYGQKVELVGKMIWNQCKKKRVWCDNQPLPFHWAHSIELIIRLLDKWERRHETGLLLKLNESCFSSRMIRV